jgi:hypothetical protein
MKATFFLALLFVNSITLASSTRFKCVEGAYALVEETDGKIISKSYSKPENPRVFYFDLGEKPNYKNIKNEVTALRMISANMYIEQTEYVEPAIWKFVKSGNSDKVIFFYLKAYNLNGAFSINSSFSCSN